MVRSVVKPSLRTASCCMVDVVNGAAGLRLRFFFSMAVTTASLPSSSFNTSACAASFGRSNCSSFAPLYWASLAVNLLRPLWLSRCTVQYSCASNARISFSRSQIRRRAGLCTRPALKPRRIFFHNNGERLKPTR